MHTLSPVHAYHPGLSSIDWSGRLAGVLFISGCNFRCGFCHNASLLGAHREGRPWEDVDAWLAEMHDSWCDSIVVTGGEPTLSPQLPELVARLKARGFQVKLDTNGSHPDVIAQLAPSLDCIAMDVKCSLGRYPEVTGYVPEGIEESLELLKGEALRGKVELRTTVVPSIHNEQEMLSMGPLIEGAELYILQPFRPSPVLLDRSLRSLPASTRESLEPFAELMRQFAKRVEIR